MVDRKIIHNDANLIAAYTFDRAYNRELFTASLRVALEQTVLFRELERMQAKITELEAALAYCEHNQLSDIMQRFDDLELRLKK